MYRKPKFLRLLHEIRQRMARDCDYDMDLFAQSLRLVDLESEPGPEPDEVRTSLKGAAKKAKRKGSRKGS